MTTDPHLVSVVIPTYYRNETLKRAIESVQNQTYDSIEIIVVDDSGERHAEAAVEEFNVRYVAHRTNRGGNPARTTGFEHANGRYVQFLDDDDRLYESKIERQVAKFDETDGVGVVYCNIHYENPPGVQPECTHRGDVLHAALQVNLDPCLTGTMLIDRRVLAGLMPLTDRAAADDVGLKIRLAERTRFEYVDEKLYWKGDAGRHRSDKPAFTDELEKIITRDHADLYAAAPDGVRERALYKMHRSRGFHTLSETRWSWRAIVAYGRCLRYTDNVEVTDIAAFVLSLFGRPGLDIGRAVKRRLDG